jgi:mannosyltransferase
MVMTAERRSSVAPRWAWVAGLSAWWWAGLIAVGGLLLRLGGLNDRSVWTDEVYGLYWASQPWLEIPSLLLRFEAHPPLSYWLLHWWAPLGGNDLLLRAPSAVLGTLLPLVVFALGRRLLGAAGGLIAAGLAALSPVLIWYSQEARPYSLLTLLLALALLALARLHERPGRWPAVGYALCLAAMLYTHYVAMLVVAVLTLAVAPGALGAAGRAWRGPWLLATAAAGLAFVPWVVAVLARVWATLPTAYTISYRAIPPSLSGIREVLVDLFALGVPFWRLPGGRPEWLLLVAGALGLLGLSRLPRAWRLVLGGTLLGSLALGWLVSQRYPVFFQTKIYVLLTPLLLLLLAAGIVHLWHWRRLAGASALALVLLIALSGWWRMAGGAPVGLAVEDWRMAAATVAGQAAPDDLVLFLPPGKQLVFARALAPADRDLTLRGVPIDVADARGLIEVPFKTEYLPALDALIAGRPRVWLVTVTAEQAPQSNVTPAVAHLAARLRQEERIDLTGIVIYRYTNPG